MENFTVAVLMLFSFALSGCAGSSLNFPKLADNPPPSQFSSLALTGEFSGEAHAQNDIGKMTVLFIKLRNDTDTPRSISLARISGITADDSKVSPIDPGEAAYEVSTQNKTSAWKGAAAGMAAGALGGAAIGGISGAVAGAVLGPPGAAAGAAIFAAAGGATGALVGAAVGALKASQQQYSEVSTPEGKALHRRLTDQMIASAAQIDGFLFFPKGNYRRISLAVSSDTAADHELIIPVVSTR